MNHIVRELDVRYKSTEYVKEVISSPRDVFIFLKDKYSDDTQENFLVLCLNNKNHVSGWSAISKGTASETIVHPREVFKHAILSNSSSVIVAHNHPSGILSPSPDDIHTTHRLVESGKILGIPVIDHIIFCTNYLSMKEEGYIQ